MLDANKIYLVLSVLSDILEMELLAQNRAQPNFFKHVKGA